MLKLYLDDTGTHDGSPVVGSGGFIGSERAWENFDLLWREVLASPVENKPALRKWHSWDCRHGYGEFSGYNQAERDYVTGRFRDVITKSDIYSATNMVDGEAWNEIIASVGKKEVANSETTSLYRVATRLLPWASMQPGGPEVAIFYDWERSNNPDVQTLVSLLQDPKTAPHNLAAFTFVSVERAAPLQAADWIATESYWYAKDYLKDQKNAVPRAHFATYLRDNKHKGNGEILDRAAIANNKMTILSGSEVWAWNK